MKFFSVVLLALIGYASAQVINRCNGNNPGTVNATLTWYESYPDPNSDECIRYNGCQWAGYFAYLDGKQPESWVRANNIVAVHQNHGPMYRLKTLRITQGSRRIEAKVYDYCADSDCNGCCTTNARPSGNLLDLEKYTVERLGSRSGQVQWCCVDC